MRAAVLIAAATAVGASGCSRDETTWEDAVDEVAIARRAAAENLRARERAGFAGNSADEVMQLFRAAFRGWRAIASEGCALWAVIDAFERKVITQPDLQYGLLDRVRHGMDAVAGKELRATGVPSGAVDWIEMQALARARDFRCEDPDRDYRPLEQEAQRGFKRFALGPLDEALHERAFFTFMLRVRLKLLLHRDPGARRHAAIADRKKSPWVLRCVTRYVAGGPSDAVAASRRRYHAFSPRRAPDASFARCSNVVNFALQRAQPKEASPTVLTTGAAFETRTALRVVRTTGEDGESLALSMHVRFANRERLAVFPLSPLSFSEFESRVAIDAPTTIRWVKGEGGKPRRDDPRDTLRVRGVEVTCAPAPPDQYDDAEVWDCPDGGPDLTPPAAPPASR